MNEKVKTYTLKIQEAINSLKDDNYDNFCLLMDEINIYYNEISEKNINLSNPELTKICELINNLKSEINSRQTKQNKEIKSLKKSEKFLNNYYKNMELPSKFIDQKR